MRPNMLFKKFTLQLSLYVFVVCCLSSFVYGQRNLPLYFRGKVSGEFRSNITRQPSIDQEEDIRVGLFFHVKKQWEIPGHRKIAFSYDLQHYRYGEFNNFTRYDQTLEGKYRQDLGDRFLLTVSDELRFRLHPSYNAFNYRRNILDFIFKLKVSGRSDFSIGYQNWFKTYTSNSSLKSYISNRVNLKFGHEFAHGTHLGLKIEFQNHEGNLYVGSTAPEQPLNDRGNRYIFRFHLDEVFSHRLIANVSYRYELDNADAFSVDQKGENFDDEDSEEFLAEDSDFGYRKHQSSFSVLYKATPKISFLLFYQFYTKGFQYWLVTPDGPKRRDKLVFLSHKIRFKLSRKISFDLRYTFETNRTNLHPYKYEINSTSIGLNFSR